MGTAQAPFASALSPATHAQHREMYALALTLFTTTDHPTTAYYGPTDVSA